MKDNQKTVFLFFIFVFAFSIPFWLLDTVYPIELLPGLPLSALGVFSPALAASLLTYRTDGSLGVSQLLKRSFDLNRVKNKSWLPVAFLINPVITVAAYLGIKASGISIPSGGTFSPAIFPMFVLFFFGALGEEIGWTGYATEPLLLRWGSLSAGLLLGVVWAAWHFIPLLQAHRSLEWIAWWSLGTISLRMIMIWLYTHTEGSIFIAAVFHAMINLCWQLFPYNGSFYDPRLFALLTLAFALAVLAMDRYLPNRHVQFSKTKATRKIKWQ